MEVTSATAGTTRSTRDGARLTQDFDQFLRLLTTQLQNQDPLSPMDSSEFTNQLVQFSSVEQQIKTNDHLEQLLTSQTLNLTALGVSFIGKDVEVAGKFFQSSGTSPAQLSYDLPSDASVGTVTVLNASGQVVHTRNAELGAGRHEFTWDGTDQNGDPVPAGTYELRVGALDANNVSLNASTFVPGHVTGLESAGDGNLLLNVSGTTVPLSAVTKIFKPSS